ncbi:hypothetical protein FD754_019013 [Muntiacus muntjak]|uniref:Mitogen-activated protein kinase binding protein 1 n=1 Tax=Muntiacus muntjak TaxID=9888 RepID=A0A5N3UZ67_MUNMU|nr:hypothetical protein FD754_019013 [Muntiacus muntjak]
MAVEGSTITSRIKNLLRSPSIKLRRSKAGNRREDLSSKVKVLQKPSPLPSPHLSEKTVKTGIFGITIKCPCFT